MPTIEPFSFQCGVIDSLNELVSAGVKALAFSRPSADRAARDALVAFAHESCQKYSTKCYPEDDPLLTDLFPVSLWRGTYLLVLYRDDHVIEEYIRLKDRKASLVASGAYFGGNRTQIASSLGRLLCYEDERVHQLLAENTEKEQF